MENRDYYEILGITKSHSEAEIKRAYRNLAMKYHPDKNPDDEHAAEKMKGINEAYAILSDSQKRQLYDTYGHAGLEGLSSADIFSSVDFASLFREFGLNDFGFSFGGGILDSLFGGNRSSARQSRKGADLKYDLEITLEEVTSGVEKKLAIPHNKSCSTCRGSGAREGGLHTCLHCKGTGQMVVEQRSGYSVFRQISACRHCRGEGKMIKEKCPDCHGKGHLQEIKELTVAIPKGVESGYAIRIDGEGEPGDKGIPAGDLYVVVDIKKHPTFERQGDDIYMIQEIGLVRAALGGEIDDLPSLNGKVKLDIPEGTQTGAVLRVVNSGIPHLKGPGKGDLYVMIKVTTPEKLTRQQKDLLTEFEHLEHSKN
jgi:molecular chaperone DnaJ